jgi:GTP-binding protein Era
MTEEKKAGNTRSGFVAMIGAPNAGKSTLVNRLVGAKVSIVTHKVQTTRTRLRGLAIHNNAQLVFVDTPGIFAPRRRLDRAMVEAAWGGAGDADVVVLVVDAAAYKEREKGGQATRAAEDIERILSGLKETKTKAVLALNKIDLLAREALLSIVADLSDRFAFEEVFMISAEKGSGVDDLATYLSTHVPEGPWLYPEDQIADVSLRLLAAEITREKLILRLHEELPYALTVETESWKDFKDGSVRIEQVVYVQRDGQKALVLGQKGKTIKEVGSEARKDMMDSFDRKVHLFLFVKVRENWGDDPERYRELGLDFPKS